MKMIKRCIPLLLVCALLVTTTSFASTKASEQISSYSIYAGDAGNGKIGIEYSITATNIMKEVGAQSIFIYKMGSFGYELVEHYTKDDAGMISTNTWFHSNTIYFQGQTGQDYHVVVTVYAKDADNASDSRSKSFDIET